MVLEGPKALSWVPFSPPSTLLPGELLHSPIPWLWLPSRYHWLRCVSRQGISWELIHLATCLISPHGCHLKLNVAKTELVIPCHSPTTHVFFPFLVNTTIIHPVVKAKHLFSSLINSISRSTGYLFPLPPMLLPLPFAWWLSLEYYLLRSLLTSLAVAAPRLSPSHHLLEFSLALVTTWSGTFSVLYNSVSSVPQTLPGIWLGPSKYLWN